MFLLKLVFWITLIVLLLPSNPDEKQALFTVAQRTVTDVSNFCGRNPQVCEQAKSGFYTVMQKLTLGAETVKDMVTTASVDEETEDLPQTQGFTTTAPEDQSYQRGLPGSTYGKTQARPYQSSTLRDNDLSVEWRGPAR